ncbi:two-component response regulator ORR27-like [Lolium perenne]|uniref:two-component response regulator ORR27-like n=1 Tax=Lolium perenne TaxID=4522 RepID=UPI003A9932DF
MENTGSASGATVDVGFPEAVVRILAVDEDPLSLITLIRTLQGCGYHVTAKASPEEALREVRQKPEGSFDLVITVARTEGTGIDGFGLLEHLRNRLPVILVSNEPEPMETMMRGYLGGAFEFLTKPLGEKELRYIWKHVSRWRINAANGSDPRWRRSAGAVNGSGEGSSRGVRQQKKRCRTTRKTQFNSLPNLHALFVEAAEVLQGTEGL